MPDPKSAAITTSREPDREAIIRAALSWVEESTNGERHRQRALLALDSLLAENEQLRAEREPGPMPHKCLNPDCGTIEYGTGYAVCPRCGGTEGRADV